MFGGFRLKEAENQECLSREQLSSYIVNIASL